ncbi:MAG: hypothetical protein ACOCXJ_09535 [Planctomycetota bacterium]
MRTSVALRTLSSGDMVPLDIAIALGLVAFLTTVGLGFFVYRRNSEDA